MPVPECGSRPRLPGSPSSRPVALRNFLFENRGSCGGEGFEVARGPGQGQGQGRGWVDVISFMDSGKTTFTLLTQGAWLEFVRDRCFRSPLS